MMGLPFPAAPALPQPAQALEVKQIVQAAHARAVARQRAIARGAMATPQEFGALANGQADDGPALRRALASGRPVRLPSGTYMVAPDPASAFRDGAAQRLAWSLRLPSGAFVLAEPGAVILQAPGAEAWTRTVVLQDAQDITILGTLVVDANVALRGKDTNEHMHGLFIFDARSSYLEAVTSRNARGDNVFIGGTGESRFSDDIVIGRVDAETAGRKNLVLQYAQATIGQARLDNRKGGAALYHGTPDTTDRHSLDVEPDNYSGQRRFVLRLGEVLTLGTGNDFTAGTAPAQADNFVVQIDTLASHITGGATAVPAWEQNGITVQCGTLSIHGIADADAQMRLAYAARLRVGSLSLRGSTRTPGSFIMQIAAAGVAGHAPEVQVGELSVVNETGSGLDVRTSALQVQTLTAQTAGPALRFADNLGRAWGAKPVRIGRLLTRDTGTDVVVAVSTFSGLRPDVVIDEHQAEDNRDIKVKALYDVPPGMAAGFRVGRIMAPPQTPRLATPP